MTAILDFSIGSPRQRVCLIAHGTVDRTDAAMVVRLCLALPTSVRELRLDLRDVAELSRDAHEAIAALLHTWRKIRCGSVIVVVGGAVAVDGPEPPPTLDPAGGVHEPLPLPDVDDSVAMTAALL